MQTTSYDAQSFLASLHRPVRTADRMDHPDPLEAAEADLIAKAQALLRQAAASDPRRAADLRDAWQERLAIVAADPDCAAMAEAVALRELIHTTEGHRA